MTKIGVFEKGFHNGWTTEKPAFTEECVFVTARKIKDYWEYKLYEILWLDTEEGMFLALCESDGEVWGDIEDLAADKYLILPKHD